MWSTYPFDTHCVCFWVKYVVRLFVTRTVSADAYCVCVFFLNLRHAWCPRLSCKSDTCYPGHYAAMISILIVSQCSSCQAHCLFFHLLAKGRPLPKQKKKTNGNIFFPYPTGSIKKIPPPPQKKNNFVEIFTTILTRPDSHCLDSFAPGRFTLH